MNVGDRVRVYPYIPHSPYYGWNATGRIALFTDGQSMIIAFDDPQLSYCFSAQPCWVLVYPEDILSSAHWLFVDGIDGKWTRQAQPDCNPCIILIRVKQDGFTDALIWSPKRRLAHVQLDKPMKTAREICRIVKRDHLTVTSCSVQSESQTPETFDTVSRIAKAVGRVPRKELNHAA